MRELAVQGANDTNGSDDRTNMNELRELHEELMRSRTRPSGLVNVDLRSQHIHFQIGDEKDELLTVTTTAISTSGLSVGSTAGWFADCIRKLLCLHYYSEQRHLFGRFVPCGIRRQFQPA